MRDCDNAMMRDRLPDLLHQGMPAADRAAVEAHVAACPECSAELEMLRAVKQALVPPTPRIEPAAVVSRVPAYRPASAWARALRSTPLRAAAAIVLVVGAASVIRGGLSQIGEPDSVVASVSSPELAVGVLADIADSDLRALMKEIGKIEALTPAEPEVVVPALPRGSE